MNHALRTSAVPSLSMWEAIFDREVKILVHEDNTAMIAICQSGRNPTMRVLERAHPLSAAYSHEQFTRGDVELRCTKSALMAADIYTKSFTASRSGGTPANL